MSENEMMNSSSDGWDGEIAANVSADWDGEIAANVSADWDGESLPNEARLSSEGSLDAASLNDGLIAE
ncbi:hypothetical protein [Streptomyces sp. SGAir0957]